MKPRLFIGSSVEGLKIAYALQDNLNFDADVTVWTQDIFKLSSNALDDLIEALSVHDFAVFVFQPDDITRIRNAKFKTVRDNVIFELGLFIGQLGKRRVFFLVPENSPNFHFPTDLAGVNPGTYDPGRADGNLKAALGRFCNQVRTELAAHHSVGLQQVGFFQEFNERFKQLFNSANELSVFFIHSRSWRETNHDLLTKFLNKKGSKLTALLPNFLNRELMNSFVANFDDGKYIEGLVKEAVRFFVLLRERHPKKVEIRMSNFYPRYSFYKFDNNAIIALYPTTPKKKNVPTFEIRGTKGFWEFFIDDFEVLTSQADLISDIHITHLNS